MNVSSFHCDHCGFKTQPQQDFPYSDEDWKADCAIMENDDDDYVGSDDGWGY
jgi:hypothetical protein